MVADLLAIKVCFVFEDLEVDHCEVVQIEAVVQRGEHSCENRAVALVQVY
jgi:hypothetical protein